nr:interleukin-17F-like [Pogona vitticeps]
MAFEHIPSLIKMLMLMLAVMNVVQGKVKQEHNENMSDNCPTQENAKFPKSVMVDIHVGHIESNNGIPSSIRNRSLSPWDYSINEDPNRFPRMIAEANCRHHFCVYPNGQGLNYSLSSVRIQQEILVLKRKQNGCKQSYWLEKQLVTVGCTCAIPTKTVYAMHGVRKRRGLIYRGK